ncbi:unnamed protein product [Dicrocoelium dendriticum]|nr:unnamed protein product [Dicrocoelium dendriticum]
MAKRSHLDVPNDDRDDDSSASPCKRLLSGSSEPILFTRVRSLEELDKRTLQLQNKKLWELQMERQAVISELRDRIEQLENRQAKDDALLCVINRYWNQLDEDGLIMLQRFDSDIEEEISTSTESFLKQLASWDKEEVPEKLQERVHFSKRIIARLLSAYERLLARQARLRRMNSSVRENTAVTGSTSTDPNRLPDPTISSSDLADGHTVDFPENSADPSSVDSDQLTQFCEEIAQLNKENIRLHTLCTNLHAKHRQNSLKLRELQDLAQTHSDSAAEWQAKYEDLDYKLSQAMSQVTRLDHRLYDAQQLNKQMGEELAQLKGSDGSNSDDLPSITIGGGTVNKNKYCDLACELEELRELVNSRTSELERLQVKLAEKVGENETLSMQIREVSENQILESPQYISLKTKFNILYSEAGQLKTQLDEARSALQSIRHSHLKHIEEMEVNEAAIQNQMRSEMLHIETQYSQLRRAHETMELDFKQALAHNEQAGPISSEMRSLISTLQTQNKQLKAEIARYRRKCKEVSQDLELVKNDLKSSEEEIALVRSALAEASAAVVAANTKTPSPAPHSTRSESKLSSEQAADVRDTMVSKSEDTPGHLTCPGCRAAADASCAKISVKSEPIGSTDIHVIQSASASSASSDEVVRQLKEQLKRSQESQKEMSVLLNMYKVIPKDQRDKAALLQCEAKLRSELSDAKEEIEKLRSCLLEAQQQNARLVQQQQQLSLQQQKTVARGSPYPKVSPIEHTPPSAHVNTTGVPTNIDRCAVTAASPTTGSQRGNPMLSPDEKLSASGSTSRTPPHSQVGSYPTSVPELQMELQLSRRRRQTLETQLELCQNRLLAAQQQEEVLLKEMEVTGQAFEDVQEQNVRLVRTLREKDDANLKLMTERLKTAQLARLLKEDKHLLEEQIRLMQAKIEALNRAVIKQEDKERLLLTNLDTLEKEANARQQAQEAYKRKAIENQQVSEDLRVTVQKYQSQLKEAQVSVQEKASAFERISFRHQRLQEELILLRRKYDRLKKIEQSHNADEVLLAELQDYKEQLTCPTCKTNKKDAILSKCFHVFCLNCLKTRYETRNRKCPKCNATFGANDYHRIYLT